MQLSIIIVNFNTPQLSIACINSIKEFVQGLNYEIILVDNAPKEDFKQEFTSCFPGLVYIFSKCNVGFGVANNMGMEIANGDYFLLLNSDTLLFNNSINKCIQYLDKPQNKQIGLLGCKLLNEDGSYQASFYPYTNNSIWNYFKSNNPLLSKLFNAAKDFKEIKETKQVGDISGAFMLLRKEVYENVNGFDPDFFLYCEETDWCRNRIAKHYGIYYFPEAEIIHLGGKSAPKNLMYLQSQLSLSLFWYKKSLLSFFLYFFFSWINGFYYLCTYPISKEQSKKQIKQYLNGLVLVFPYIFKDIIWHKRSFGARKEALILKEARPIFFQ